MSEFSEAFAGAFAVSTTVFGDTCSINGTSYPCVILSLVTSDEIQAGRAGRVQVVEGAIVMATSAWTEAGGAKGTRITIGTETYRVSNKPEAGFESATVEIQLGPLT